MSEQIPDPAYRIDPDARARLQLGVDPDALERLLQFFPASSRELHLEMFMTRVMIADKDGRIPVVRVLTRISNPVQHALLEEVWQPYWSAVPDRELYEGAGGPPGREMAQRRRRREFGE